GSGRIVNGCSPGKRYHTSAGSTRVKIPESGKRGAETSRGSCDDRLVIGDSSGTTPRPQPSGGHWSSQEEHAAHSSRRRRRGRSSTSSSLPPSSESTLGVDVIAWFTRWSASLGWTFSTSSRRMMSLRRQSATISFRCAPSVLKYVSRYVPFL